MTTAAVPKLSRMAVVQVVKAEDREPGMVECKAPDCNNWFHKNSGRHIYCKAPDCTYRRGAPPAAELVSPEGAAEELMRRLQENDEAEVGPALLGERVRAVQAALAARDPEALFGALIDVGTCVVWWADRAGRGELPKALPPRPVRAQATVGQRPVGLVYAAVAGHRRTYALGDQRVDLIYALVEARDHLASTELAVQQTQGSPAEEEARVHNLAARTRIEQIERALQSVEAAWRERGHSLQELEQAAAASQPPVTNGAPT